MTASFSRDGLRLFAGFVRACNIEKPNADSQAASPIQGDIRDRLDFARDAEGSEGALFNSERRLLGGRNSPARSSAISSERAARNRRRSRAISRVVRGVPFGHFPEQMTQGHFLSMPTNEEARLTCRASWQPS